MDLISLHIPKTGGTSFYAVLQQVYGPAVSESYRRRDYQAAVERADGPWEATFPQEVRVLHGHFRYPEVARLHHTTNAKLITWLRDPVHRVVSNYRFFLAGLQNPERNPRNYELNRHRRHETLLEYAARPECRNVMSTFLLDAAVPDDFFFIGRLEHFSEDLYALAHLLDWDAFEIPHRNRAAAATSLPDEHTLQKIRAWNARDIALYEQFRSAAFLAV